MPELSPPRTIRHVRGLAMSLALFTSAFLVAGCGQANKMGRVPFSGEVTLDGEPLESGSIALEPTGKGGNEKNIRSGAAITDGKFQVTEMKGLPPGEYLVRINAAAGTPAAPKDQPPGAPSPVQKELIPPEYNVQSEKTVAIKEGAENHFTFDIKT